MIGCADRNPVNGPDIDTRGASCAGTGGVPPPSAAHPATTRVFERAERSCESAGVTAERWIWPGVDREHRVVGELRAHHTDAIRPDGGVGTSRVTYLATVSRAYPASTRRMRL